MEKVRIGIIGVGNMGSNHARNIYNGKVKNMELAAIADTNPQKITWVKETFENVATFSTADEMFKSGLADAVIVATPHYDHPSLVIEALKHNLHALCEKPAGVYTKQVREMNEFAKKSNKVFAIMFNNRTNAIYKKMHDIVQSGELGEMRRCNWIITDWYRPQYYYDSGGWRATWDGEGGGVLLNQCPHNLDLWQWICGMPNKITAFCHYGKWHDIEVEDDVTAYVEYANGATGAFITTTGDAPGTNRFEVTCDNGKLVCEQNKLMLYKLDTPVSEFTKTVTESFPYIPVTPTEVETDGSNPQHIGIMESFAQAILKGTPLIADGIEGINGLTISNAMHLSSWLNKTIELPLDEELFLSELNKRRMNSRKKENVESKIADMKNSY